MDKINTWRDNFSWFIAAITVAIAYELRNNNLILIPNTESQLLDSVLPAVLATALLLLSLSIARKFARMLISCEKIRALIMRENHVEGYWNLKTEENSEEHDEESGSPLSPPGILWLRYEPTINQFCVTTTRLDSKGEPYEVPSRLINMREENHLLLYVNYFVVSPEGPNSSEGVSKGWFQKSLDSKGKKDKFIAYIFAEGEPTRRQTAKQITESQIKQYKTKANSSGQSWGKLFLEDKVNHG